MAGDVLVINANPDPAPERLCAALAAAYRDGAEGAGRAVTRLDLATLDLPPLKGKADFEHGRPPPDAARAQALIEDAAHLAILFPIWLGGPPSLLGRFLEQTLRPAFVLGEGVKAAPFGPRRLRGRSVRLVATMGMPALAYRLWYLGRGVGALRQGALGFSGFGPVRATLVGSVDAMTPARAERLAAEMRRLGAAGR